MDVTLVSVHYRSRLCSSQDMYFLHLRICTVQLLKMMTWIIKMSNFVQQNEHVRRTRCRLLIDSEMIPRRVPICALL